MKKSDAETVGEIINRLLSEENLDKKFDEQKISYIWPEVVGQGINRYTVSRYVKDGVLYLHMSSSVLRNDLMLSRTALIRRLNEAVGREVIHDIVIR